MDEGSKPHRLTGIEQAWADQLYHLMRAKPAGLVLNVLPPVAPQGLRVEISRPGEKKPGDWFLLVDTREEGSVEIGRGSQRWQKRPRGKERRR